MRPAPGLLVAVWLAVATVVSVAAPPPAPCDKPTTTILIVRHAERAGAQLDSLSADGVARAQELARVVTKANVRAVYHSDTKRTRDTAAPSAAALSLSLVPYPAKECGPLIDAILRDHPGDTVLVVAHSNTVPLLVAAAGAPAMADLDEKEFDDLFVVSVSCRDRPVTVTHLQYGAASPR
jgi:broad specificity phosphatase PhoE